MNYKPKAKRKGMSIPFGYFIHPTDSSVLLPDKNKLNALHYAFAMRTKYKTSYRDCALWLQAATGDRLAYTGFMYLYKKWARQLRKTKKAEIAARKQEILNINTKYIEKIYPDYEVNTDENADISSLAYEAAEKAFK